MDELRVKLFEMLKQTIRPEFLNRIDEIILFKPLTMSEIRQIVDLQLKVVQRTVAAKNIQLEFTDDLRTWLAKIGFDPSYGARPLKRLIQKHVINKLSEQILSGAVSEGDTIEVTQNDRGHVEFTTKVKAELAG